MTGTSFTKRASSMARSGKSVTEWPHDQDVQYVIDYWMRRADESLASTRLEEATGHYHFAVNRAYYACFYAASAVLLQEGCKFVKHSGVRSAVHQDLVKTGRLDVRW